MKTSRKKKTKDHDGNHDPEHGAAGDPQREGRAVPADAPAGEAEGEAGAGELAQLRAEVAELRDKWLRAVAETDNLRKRARADIDEARRYGAAAFLGELLDIMDNFQRALASPPPGIDAGFLEGLGLIEQQWLAVLERHGVTAVPSAPGHAFDPQVHNALLEQESGDAAPGSILAEVKRGYRLHDRLLREAHVVVAKAPGSGRAADPAGGASAPADDES